MTSTKTQLVSKKCNCGLGNSGNCKNCSKVKMTICLKNGQEQHKVGTYKKTNPVWYSFMKYNRLDKMRIASKMEYRLRNHRLASAAQVLLFYEKGAPSHFHKVVL